MGRLLGEPEADRSARPKRAPPSPLKCPSRRSFVVFICFDVLVAKIRASSRIPPRKREARKKDAMKSSPLYDGKWASTWMLDGARDALIKGTTQSAA